MSAKTKQPFNNLSFSILLCLFFPWIANSKEASCPAGWTHSTPSESCIRLVHESITWTEARSRCMSHDGDLVTIMDDRMNNFVMGQVGNRVGGYWIGLNDRKREGEFHWLDSVKKVHYTNWAAGEPDNSKDNQDCIVINFIHGDGEKWCDLNCNLKRFSYICERSLVCANQTFGENCSETCSPNCAGPENACDNNNGSCLMGCDVGYQGDRCNAVCANQTIGSNCSETCSPNCAGPENSCDNKNGSCVMGCDVGYQGDRCNTACANQTFGTNCSETCSPNCAGPENACDNKNGSCVMGCDVGYQGDRCNIVALVQRTDDIIINNAYRSRLITAAAVASIFIISLFVFGAIIMGGTLDEILRAYSAEWSSWLESEEIPTQNSAEKVVALEASNDQPDPRSQCPEVTVGAVSTERSTQAEPEQAEGPRDVAQSWLPSWVYPLTRSNSVDG